MTDSNELHNYIKKNEEFHEVELIERAEMKKEITEVKEMLKDVHKALFGNKETNEEGLIKNMEIVSNLKGFWRVVGFGLGFIGLASAGVAGAVYIYGLFRSHA